MEDKTKEIEQLRKEFNERIDALLKKETKFEVGKWYKYNTNKNVLVFLNTEYKEEAYCGFGIDGLGDWTNSFYINKGDNEKMILATESEIKEALKTQIIKELTNY